MAVKPEVVIEAKPEPKVEKPEVKVEKPEIKPEPKAEKTEVKVEKPDIKPAPREGFVVVAMDIKFNSLYHPYQRRWVPTIDVCPEGLEMERDSWLDCQIEAGLVKVIK